MAQPPTPGFSQTHRQLLTASAVLALVFAIGGALFLDDGQLKKDSAENQVVGESDYPYHYEYKNAAGSYLSGKMAAAKGDIKTALKHLGETMAYQHSDKELLAQAYHLSVLAGNFDQAGVYSEEMAADAEDRLLSPELLQAVLAVKQGKFALADKKLDEMIPKGASALFLPVMKGWIAIGLRQKPDMKSLDEGIQFSGQFEPLLHYQVALLLDAAGLPEDAKAHYDAAIEGAELSYRVASAIANFYQRQGDTKKLKILQEKYTQQYGHGLGEISEQPLVSTPREGVAEIFYGISSILFSLEAYTEAQVPLQLALDLRPDFDAVHLLQANLLEQQEKYDEAYAMYEKLANHPAFGLQASIRMAYCLQDSGKSKKALALLEKIRNQYPDEAEPILTIADILRIEKRYKKAIETYTDALQLLQERKAKRWSVLYARGISYERNGEWEKAEADFLEALRLEPNQPDVLNYLGYSWLVQKKHLQQAKEMIEKAMAARPQDAHIIDSMGWAMYQLGHYEDALDYLEQAIDLTPRDPTVNEHLGDVYWRMGYQLQARYQWERALFFGPEEPGQKEYLRTKLSNGLPAISPAKREMLSQNATSQRNVPFLSDNSVQTK